MFAGGGGDSTLRERKGGSLLLTWRNGREREREKEFASDIEKWGRERERESLLLTLRNGGERERENVERKG